MKHANALATVARKTVLTLADVQARYAHVTGDRERLYALADFLDAVDAKELVIAGMQWDFESVLEPYGRSIFDAALFSGESIPECGAQGCAMGYGYLIWPRWSAERAMKALCGSHTMDRVLYAGGYHVTPAIVATRIREALA